MTERTLQERLREQASLHYEGPSDSDVQAAGICTEAADRIEALESTNARLVAALAERQWVAVEEHLPPVGQYVTVLHCGVVQLESWRWTGEDWTAAGSEDIEPASRLTFSHWMPLPKALASGGEKGGAAAGEVG
jgi:hypothetical protein